MNVTAAYLQLRELFKKYPEASILLTFNLRKQDRQNGRPNLLTNARGWLEEVSGSLDILNRADVRLGIDFLDDDQEIRVINGVRRSEDFDPLLILPVEGANGKAGFQLAPASQAGTLAFTPKQREQWGRLPNVFRIEDVADKGVPRASLYRLTKRACSLGILEHVGGVYRKVLA